MSQLKNQGTKSVKLESLNGGNGTGQKLPHRTSHTYCRAFFLHTVGLHRLVPRQKNTDTYLSVTFGIGI